MRAICKTVYNLTPVLFSPGILVVKRGGSYARSISTPYDLAMKGGADSKVGNNMQSVRAKANKNVYFHMSARCMAGFSIYIRQYVAMHACVAALITMLYGG